LNFRDPEQILVNAKPLDEYLRDEGIEFKEDEKLVVEEGEKDMFVGFVRRLWVEFAKTLRGGDGENATMHEAVFLQRVLDAVESSAAEGGQERKLRN